jgi:hypothetical protein
MPDITVRKNFNHSCTRRTFLRKEQKMQYK